MAPFAAGVPGTITDTSGPAGAGLCVPECSAKNSSVSAAARKLGIDRKTVRKYRDMEMDQIAEYRRARRRRKRGLSSCAKWIEERVEAMAEDGVINAQAIYEQLKPLGFQGSARSVRRFVQAYRKKHTKKRIYEPFETEAGHQAMVDFGEKRRVRIGQARSRVHFATMILSYSRKKYTEWYDRPVDTQEFIRFHQRAFQNLGGIPGEVVYDQTKLAVLSELYGEVEFNQSFYSYATWCVTRIRSTLPKALRSLYCVGVLGLLVRNGSMTITLPVALVMRVVE